MIEVWTSLDLYYSPFSSKITWKILCWYFVKITASYSWPTVLSDFYQNKGKKVCAYVKDQLLCCFNVYSGLTQSKVVAIVFSICIIMWYKVLIFLTNFDIFDHLKLWYFYRHFTFFGSVSSRFFIGNFERTSNSVTCLEKCFSSFKQQILKI